MSNASDLLAQAEKFKLSASEFSALGGSALLCRVALSALFLNLVSLALRPLLTNAE